MIFFLFFLIAAIVLGIIGGMANSLGYLLVIAVVLFVADVGILAMRWSRRTRRRPLR